MNDNFSMSVEEARSSLEGMKVERGRLIEAKLELIRINTNSGTWWQGTGHEHFQNTFRRSLEDFGFVVNRLETLEMNSQNYLQSLIDLDIATANRISAIERGVR